jgi:transcription antitermination factor NusA-like protein
MKTITVPVEATEINALLEQAQAEDLLVRAADGNAYIVVAVDDFEEEIARTRQNARLMALLDKRARQTETRSLEDVKRELDLAL